MITKIQKRGMKSIIKERVGKELKTSSLLAKGIKHLLITNSDNQGVQATSSQEILIENKKLKTLELEKYKNIAKMINQNYMWNKNQYGIWLIAHNKIQEDNLFFKYIAEKKQKEIAMYWQLKAAEKETLRRFEGIIENKKIDVIILDENNKIRMVDYKSSELIKDKIDHKLEEYIGKKLEENKGNIEETKKNTIEEIKKEDSIQSGKKEENDDFNDN